MGQFSSGNHKWTWVAPEMGNKVTPSHEPKVAFFCEDAHPLFKITLRRPLGTVNIIKSDADAQAVFEHELDSKCALEFECQARLKVVAETLEIVQYTGKNKGTRLPSLSHAGISLSDWTPEDLFEILGWGTASPSGSRTGSGCLVCRSPT